MTSRLHRVLAAGMFALFTHVGLAAGQAQHDHAAPPPAPVGTDRPAPVVSRDAYAIEVPRAGQRVPTIDGLLDDEAWRNAVVIDQFTQQEPVEGRPATERPRCGCSTTPIISTSACARSIRRPSG